MSHSPSKVNSGPPIWLWLILIPLTLAVIVGLYINSMPPDLEKAYQAALTALDEPEGKETFDKNIALLEGVPGYEDRVRYLNGRLAISQRRDPKALKLFAEIPEDSPLKPEAYRRAGDTYRQMGEFEKAIDAYRKSVAGDPEGGLDARLNLASLYFFAGALDLASQELDKNLELDSGHENSRMMRANLRTTREEYELAKEDYEAVLDLPGKFSSVQPRFVGGYFECLMKLNDKEKLKKVAQDHLGAINEASIRSSVLSEIGEYRDAMVSLQGSEGGSPDSPDYKRAQLKLLLLEGNIEEAERLAKEMTVLLPRNIDIMKLASKAFAESGNTELQARADENIDQLQDLTKQLKAAIAKVSNDVTDGPGRAEVAKLYRELGDYSQMDKWYNMARILDKSLSNEYEEARSGKGFPTEPLVSFDPKKEDPETKEGGKEGEKEGEKAGGKEEPKADGNDEPKPDNKDEPPAEKDETQGADDAETGEDAKPTD